MPIPLRVIRDTHTQIAYCMQHLGYLRVCAKYFQLLYVYVAALRRALYAARCVGDGNRDCPYPAGGVGALFCEGPPCCSLTNCEKVQLLAIVGKDGGSGALRLLGNSTEEPPTNPRASSSIGAVRKASIPVHGSW